MIEEIAKKVIELYNKKSELCKALAKLNDLDFEIKGVYENLYYYNGVEVPQVFRQKIKEFVTTLFTEELEKVDKELKELHC